MSLYCKTAASTYKNDGAKKVINSIYNQCFVRKHTLKYSVAKGHEGLQLTLEQFKSVCVCVCIKANEAKRN